MGVCRHRAGPSVHVKLAAGEPAQVSRVGGIEEQQGSLTVGCEQV